MSIEHPDFGRINSKPLNDQASRECMRTHCNVMSRKIEEVIHFLKKPGYHKDEFRSQLAFLEGVKVGLESLNAYEDQFE